MRLTIGVDIGGTKVAAGVVDERGHITDKLRRATPSASPARTEQVICDVVAELSRRHRVEAVGLGAAGFVDENRAIVTFAPNLAWRDEPLRARVRALVGLPVVVENDANASAWAEARFGAARGHRDVVFVAVGTGIGAGLVLNGALYRGRWGMAGEPGHYRVVPEGRLCGCGNRGCWEQYASGSALVAEAREFARRSPGAAVRLLQLGGGAPEGIRGAHVTQAAQEQDPGALRCFGIVGGWLGQGLADLAAVLDPGCFIIGGGVSESGDLLLGPARTAYEKALTGGRYRPRAEIRMAELGADAGVVGAADLARQVTALGGHTTAPLSGPESRGGPSLSRTTSSANPATNAATAQKAAQPGICQPSMTASSRYPGPPNRAAHAPLLTGSRRGSGGGGGGTKWPSSSAGGTGADGRTTRACGGPCASSGGSRSPAGRAGRPSSSAGPSHPGGTAGSVEPDRAGRAGPSCWPEWAAGARPG